MPTDRATLETMLREQESACAAAFETIAVNRRGIAKLLKRIADDRKEIDAKRAVIDGAKSVVAECKPNIRAFKQQLRQLPKGN